MIFTSLYLIFISNQTNILTTIYICCLYLETSTGLYVQREQYMLSQWLASLGASWKAHQTTFTWSDLLFWLASMEEEF